MEYQLSENGKKLQKIVEENKAEYDLTLIYRSFNVTGEGMIKCAAHCGCLLTVGAHNKTYKRSADTFESLLFYYTELGFSRYYISGVVNGYDATHRQNIFSNSSAEFEEGYNDGYYFQQLYKPNSRNKQYELMGLR